MKEENIKLTGVWGQLRQWRQGLKTDISNKANTIGVPVFVLNLERRHDRREHMLALLRGVGFSNVTVVNAISYEQLDWDSFQTVVLCSGP